MDTNMAQALKMAGGILIALIIIATLTYFFRELTPFQQQLEDIKELEQTADFNKQYEVYNKSLMLGVDIISVINKAYSNNMAYIDAYGYSEDLRDNYLIDIEIQSIITLEQSLVVYDIYDDYSGQIIEKDKVKVTNSSLSPDSQSQLKNKLKISDIVDVYSPINIQGNLIDPDRIFVSNEKEKYTNENMYKYIIKDSAQELKRNVRNNNSTTINEWGVATLETYTYNLKTKKFRCIDVQNSEQTGRIIKMTFEEI